MKKEEPGPPSTSSAASNIVDESSLLSLSPTPGDLALFKYNSKTKKWVLQSFGSRKAILGDLAESESVKIKKEQKDREHRMNVRAIFWATIVSALIKAIKKS